MCIKVLVLEIGQDLSPVSEQVEEDSSYAVYPASSCHEALDILSNNAIDILITPVRLVAMDTCRFLEKAVKIQESVQFIVLGGQEDRKKAIDLMMCQSVTFISTTI